MPIAEQADPSWSGSFEHLVVLSGKLVEAVGVATIVASVPAALILAWRHSRQTAEKDLYPEYRRVLGRGILLGLEFLVAADIIRTVSHVPTIINLFGLALIVLIRTFLSFTLEVEIDGHWPWQRSKTGHN